jgi:UDP-2,4-diacetamido-2,4,6-trideoxy-beta-L-altropyranose hydrolase
LIRADAGLAIGTGHVMRCLALAHAWRDSGGHAAFLMAKPPAVLRDRLLKESFQVIELSSEPGSVDDANSTVHRARSLAASWIVVDGYHFGTDYQARLKSAGHKILFLDDYGHASCYAADVVLNQNLSACESFYADRNTSTQLLLGTRYCLLRPEFLSWQNWNRKIVSRAHRILVTLGGTDPANLTGNVIRALALIGDSKIEAAVAIGGSNENLDSLRKIADETGLKINIYHDAPNMPDLMAWADVAVSAAGTTCWEMCFLGLPALLIAVAENQIPIARELSHAGGAIDLGEAGDVSVDDLAAELKRLLESKARREQISLNCHTILDGKGASRVVSVLRSFGLHLRPANEQDCQLLWEWANDADVRTASFSSQPIPWATHVSWFAKKLRENRSRMLIAENEDGTPIGQVRFDARSHAEAEIAISIAKPWRGQGLAVSLIMQAVSTPGTEKFSRIHAFVKPENTASVKAFKQAGFKQISVDEIHGTPAIHFIYEADMQLAAAAPQTAAVCL